MSKVIKVIFCSIIFFSTMIYSQTVDPYYQVAKWPGFRSGAVSFTFDDNCPNQLRVAMPMFDQYGFKMTLFTVINWGPNWAALQKAASEGHEIASHTLSHRPLNSLPDSEQIVELRDSRDDIDSRIKSQKCLTIAYPNCVMADPAICGKYYIAARGCSGSVERSTPSNFLDISSIICGTQGSVQRAQDFIDKMNDASRSGGWTVFLIHAIDGDNGYSPTNSSSIKGALEYLDSTRDNLWEATFANVVRYIKERNNVSVKEIASDDTVISVKLTQTLNDTIYNYPVTVRRMLPDGWDSASAYQNGKIIESKITNIKTYKYIIFDAVPDSGVIKLKKYNITAVSNNLKTQVLNPELKQNYPNPFNPVTKIRYSIPNAGTHGDAFVRINVYDVLGNKIATLVNKKQRPGNYEVTFDGSGLASGIYFYSLTAGNFLQTKKLILLK